MSQDKLNSIAPYYAAWNDNTPTVHLRTGESTTALCGFKITNLTNVAYEPIGASADMPNLNSLCAVCANIAQFDKALFSCQFGLSEYILQQNDIKEPVLINGKRCDYSSELDDNLRKKLFDVRVQKRIKHCAKRAKRFIAPFQYYHFSASAVIAVGSSKEHTTHEFGYTQPIEGNTIKDKHLYAFRGKYAIYKAIGTILNTRPNLTHLPFLHLTLTFEIKPSN